MDLNEISVFARVVQAKSFRRAAQELGMPASTVSAKVASLEKRLGTTLIRRTTRKLFVTAAGQAYFDRCLKGLSEIGSAEAEVMSEQSEPQGRLRITAPVELGSLVLRDITAQFVKKNPKVKVELVLTDRQVDLVGEGIDLAIRAGDLKDSSLVAKKIGGTVYFALMASPTYLKSQKALQHPRDLAQHQCLQFTPMGLDSWELSNRKSKVRVPMTGGLVVNDLSTIKGLAVSGAGIALLPNFMCDIESKSGKLVRVLPEWQSNANPVHLVYPAQKFVSSPLRAFITLASDSLQTWMRKLE